MEKFRNPRFRIQDLLIGLVLLFMMYVYISTEINPGDNFSGPRGINSNNSEQNWNQQQNNDGYSNSNWVNPNPQPSAPSAPAPDFLPSYNSVAINSNDTEQIQVKPRRWF